jgi:hypothetical protein
MFSITPKLMATSAVIAAVVSMAPVAFAQMPIISDGAQTYPSGVSTKNLNADQRSSLLAQLQAAKQHDRQARAGWSQDPIVQGNYGEKIRHIDRIVAGLQKGEDYPMSEVKSAMASPGTAPY